MNQNHLIPYPSTPPTFRHLKRTLICFIILFLTIIFNYFNHDQYMDLSIEISVKLQTFNLDPSLTILSTAAIASALSYIYLNTFLSSKKVSAFRTLFGLSLCIFIHSFLKLIFMDQRPSFLSKRLKEGTHYCEKEYGMPSGHSIFAAYAFFCIANQYKKNHQHLSMYTPVLIFFTIFITGLGIAFSRLYFGVHSFNQTIIGLLIGTFIFTFINSTKKILDLYIFKLVFKENQDKRNHVGFLLVGLTLVFLFILYTAFLFSYQDNPTSTEFYNKIVNCTIVKNNFNSGFSVKILQDGLIFTNFMGIIIGVSNCPKSIINSLCFCFDKNFKNIFLRMGCVFLINLPMGLAFLVHLTNPFLLVLRPLIFFPFFGFLTGRFSVDLVRLFGISVKDNNLMEKGERETGFFHL